MPPKPTTTADQKTSDPDTIYKERFNTLAPRLQRQLHGLQKLASARNAVPSDATRQRAIQWLERHFSTTISALKGVKITATEGPLD